MQYLELQEESEISSVADDKVRVPKVFSTEEAIQ